ncbi:MAG TPA: penicillin-binding transpeptidase domain-containing protein, partial [Acidimicrobiales bacterium]|nr:penicillin-binding transpeptidase domain-containing protein [Acidimicrobiales bacterium]
GRQDTALFVAMAPADNPQYAVAVVMEESGFGGEAAAPVARRILQGLAGQKLDPVTRGGGID